MYISSINFVHFIYIRALFIDAQTFIIVIYFSIFTRTPLFFTVIFLILKIILADINIATPIVLWSLFAKYIFSQPFTSTYLYFLIYSVESIQLDLFFLQHDNLPFDCLFSPFTFNVVIDHVGFTSAILLYIFYILMQFYTSVPPVLPSFVLKNNFQSTI